MTKKLLTPLLLINFAVATSASAGPIALHNHYNSMTPTVKHAISTQNSDADLKNASHFIEQLANDAISFLNDDSLAHNKKQARFKAMLDKRFDMRSIGRFAIGKYWKLASENEKQQYQKLFNAMVLEVYSRRFSDYNGQKLTINSARQEGKRDILVTSYIKQDNGPDIQLDWRLRHRKNGLRVIDITVEGVSMALTQRSEFSSVIQRGGGKISALLDHLTQK